jgi:dihydrofolate reductase
MKASVFIGTSVDGFIARADGDLDWLPPGGGEEHGYDAFMATVDALVIGRKTFEKVLTFDPWAYGEKPVFVLSTRALAPAPPAPQTHVPHPLTRLTPERGTRPGPRPPLASDRHRTMLRHCS